MFHYINKTNLQMSQKNDFFTILNHLQQQAPPISSAPYGTQSQAGTATSAPSDVEFAPIDLVSNPDSYEIWVNMPGFEKDSIEVTIQDKVLKIVGKKSVVKKPNKNLVISRRPSLDHVCHQVRLKTPIDVQKTENSLIVGVFYLKLYKSQPDDGVRIPL
jgi:HSP20 family molecular chaperone IbpA